MFRTSIRRFATTAKRAAETVAQMEQGSQQSMSISRAQGIAKDGFVSGMLLYTPLTAAVQSAHALGVRQYFNVLTCLKR